jgi:transposase
LLLPLAQVTERSLLEGLDALEQHDSQALQQRIFHRVVDTYRLSISSIIYDVTNTYFYGKRCPLGKYGHDKDGVKGRPLIQIGLAVAKNSGIPIAHQVFPGNIHDAKMFQDFVTTLRHCRIAKGLIVYDRGIASAQNLKSINELHWQTLCGLPIRGQLAHKVRAVAARQAFIQLANRVRVNKTVFYARLQPYALAEVPGTLAICFNEQMRRDLRESRYDEILHAQELLRRRQTIKAGLEKYFGRGQVLRQERVREAEQFDGYTCLFATGPLRQDEMLRIYFDKDLVEKAFQTLKGVARLQPIRHWLYNRVTAHVFICYLAYLLLALLQYRLRPLAITATEALTELETMYKVYLRDAQKGFQISRVVTLTKKQELILRTIDRKLLKPSV